MTDPSFLISGPSSFVHEGGELPLSNLGQLEILRGAVERGVALRMIARGSSMSPFIRDRDVLTIAPLKDYTPCLGDVIAFVQPKTNRLTIHRIIARTSAGWLLSGDNSPETDGIIKREDMLGIITRIERNGRDVHLGLGMERTFIARLNRGNGLLELKKMWHLPRRILANILRRVQALSLYRIVGRQVTLRININEANADDLVAVQRHFNPNEYDNTHVPDPSVTNWVAKYRERIIGFVQLVRQPPGNGPYVNHWLYSLEVWGLYRGLGIGARLTQCVIDQAVAEGASELFLFVFEDNGAAIKLYNKVGFEHVILPAHEVQLAAEKEKFGRRRIVMSKKLA